MRTQAPFQQLPFDALPAHPRVPHRFGDLPVERVPVDGPFGRHELAVRRTGSGPPLLLVHGLMTAGYSWRYVLDGLGEHFTLVIPDLVGSGDSDKPPGRYDLPALAQSVAALQRALGLDGVPTVGNSLGGLVCLQRLQQAPDAFERLVVLHAPGATLKRLRLLHAVMRLPGSTGLLRRLVARDPHRWAHRNVHYYDETLKSREEARVYGDALVTPGGIEAFASTLRWALAPTGFRTLRQSLAARPPTCPVQLVYATTDPVVPPHVGHTLHALLPDAELHWLDDASHFAHVDAVPAFLAVARPFLLAARS